jgi:hypothetical protein
MKLEFEVKIMSNIKSANLRTGPTEGNSYQIYDSIFLTEL